MATLTDPDDCRGWGSTEKSEKARPGKGGRPLSRDELAALGFEETVLTLLAIGHRVMLMRSTMRHQYVLRVVSCSQTAFNFARAVTLLEADPAQSTIVVFGCARDEAEALAERFLPVGTVFEPLLLANVDPKYQLVAMRHAHETGEYVKEQIGFKIPKPLPPSIQRTWDRLGNDGYELLAAQSVFAASRAAPRVAAQAMLAFRQANASKKRRDGLVALQLGWNVVMQAYIALENLAAFYESLRATVGGEFSTFATTYLRFGRTDALAQHTVQNTFQRLGSTGGEKDLARTFSVPLHRGHLEEYGLNPCAVDPDKLVAIGKTTATVLAERFRRLGALVVFNASPTGQFPYDPRKTLAKRAYDALHHGFSLVLPLFAPYPQAVTVYGGFLDEDEFAADVRARDFGGLMLDLDVASGTTSRIVAPSTLAQLKPFANAVTLGTTMLHELTKYALDKFGSVDGRMPYLINSSLQLTPEEYRELRRCLNVLCGKK